MNLSVLWDTMRINDPHCVPQHRQMTCVVGMSHIMEKTWENLVKHGKLFPVVGHNMDKWPALCPSTQITDPYCVPQCGSLICVMSHKVEQWFQWSQWISPPNRKRNQNHPRLPLSGSKLRVWCKKRRSKISWHCPFNVFELLLSILLYCICFIPWHGIIISALKTNTPCIFLII